MFIVSHTYRSVMEVIKIFDQNRLQDFWITDNNGWLFREIHTKHFPILLNKLVKIGMESTSVQKCQRISKYRFRLRTRYTKSPKLAKVVNVVYVNQSGCQYKQRNDPVSLYYTEELSKSKHADGKLMCNSLIQALKIKEKQDIPSNNNDWLFHGIHTHIV